MLILQIWFFICIIKNNNITSLPNSVQTFIQIALLLSIQENMQWLHDRDCWSLKPLTSHVEAHLNDDEYASCYNLYIREMCVYGIFICMYSGIAIAMVDHYTSGKERYEIVWSKRITSDNEYISLAGGFVQRPSCWSPYKVRRRSTHLANRIYFIMFMYTIIVGIHSMSLVTHINLIPWRIAGHDL